MKASRATANEGPSAAGHGPLAPVYAEIVMRTRNLVLLLLLGPPLGRSPAKRRMGWLCTAILAATIVPVLASCAVDYRRAGVGRSCRRDDHCRPGLVCRARQCGLPAATSGTHADAGSQTMSSWDGDLRRDGAPDDGGAADGAPLDAASPWDAGTSRPEDGAIDGAAIDGSATDGAPFDGSPADGALDDGAVGG